MRRVLLVTGATVAAALAVAGTVIPLAASYSTRRNPLTAAIQHSPASRVPSASAGPQPPRQVQHVWRPGMPQSGISVYWQNNPADPDQTLRAKAQRILDHVVWLGANSVSISFPFVMDTSRASVVRADDAMTPSPERLAIVLQEANRRGLRISIRPLLDERNLTKDAPNIWRGLITPGSTARWFASYRDLMVPYAATAEAAHAATFVVGTELSSMERAAGWQVVVQGIQAAYHGELQYDANHDRLAASGPAGIPLAVDAYPPIKAADTATVDQLVAGWNAWLDRGVGSGPRPGLLLSEVAISARTGAYAQPWSWFANGPILPQIQQNWFDAACQVVRERNLAGIYFWTINMDSDPTAAPPDAQPMDFVGRPGEYTVAACFATLGRRPGGSSRPF